MQPVAPLFNNARKKIYDLETEVALLRADNASQKLINAKLKEIDDVIYGRRNKH
jgi:hypothetical protein